MLNNNLRTFIVSLLLVLLVAGCTATPAPATPTVEKTGTAVATQEATAQPTVAPKPSATRFPTDTPTPTGEPTVPLSADGPWLVYSRVELSPSMPKLENEPDAPLSDKWLRLISHSSATIHAAPKPDQAAQLPSIGEFGIMNQNGSGRVVITWPECTGNVNDFLMAGENASSYMIDMGWKGVYIFRPSQATGMLVHQVMMYGENACHTYFTGDEKSGLLASIYQAADNAIPELMIYELPGGKIRNRFPLIKCPRQTKDCEKNPTLLNYISVQDPDWSPEPRWSPNGRYLAFAALLDATSSDLYIYDSEERSLRRLTSGPDWVGSIEWSPDGMQIIMGEIPNDEEHPFTPSGQASLWSVSVSSNKITSLGSFDPFGHHISYWLDDERFIDYNGYTFSVDWNAKNLRLVNTGSGETRVLFDGDFRTEEFDPIHETFVITAINTEQSGIYLVSTKNSPARYLGDAPYLSFVNWGDISWDKKTGLFISSDDCENDPQSFQAFDYLGNFTCVPKPAPEPTPKPVETHPYPAPNGKWTVFLKDGVWLESQGKAAIQVSPETAYDIIWCPDSTGFFFSVPQPSHNNFGDRQWNLYHVSLPDLTIKMVDDGIWSSGLHHLNYYWLGGTK